MTLRASERRRFVRDGSPQPPRRDEGADSSAVGAETHRARATCSLVASAVAITAALLVTVSAMGADEGAATAGAEDRAAEERLGPIRVRSFRPMHTGPVRLRERHGPVYFRSLLAEPTASDRDVDRCPPLACGAAVADWLMFTFRALGFPVEMALAPPWQTERLGR